MSESGAGAGAPSVEKSKTSGGKLNTLVQKLQTSAGNSRDSSPEPAAAKEQRAGSSRRKPQVTRKVVEDEQFYPEEVSPIKALKEDDVKDKGDKEEGRRGGSVNDKEDGEEPEEEPIDIDEDGNFIVPEGTVVVEPEEVVDQKPTFKGPEFRGRTGNARPTRTAKYTPADQLKNIHCTACNKQINPFMSGSIKRHPVLKVLICKKCYNWYTSAEVDQDSDGIDEQCRWCGEGGNLICCDFCHNAFCKGCIKRNLGRAEYAAITEADADSKWHCYVCDMKPLAQLIQNCTDITEEVERQKKEQAAAAKAAKNQQSSEEKKKSKPQQMGDKKGTPKAAANLKIKMNFAGSDKKSPVVPTGLQLIPNVNQMSAAQVAQIRAQNVQQFHRASVQRSQQAVSRNPVPQQLMAVKPALQQKLRHQPQPQQQKPPPTSVDRSAHAIPISQVETVIYKLIAATQSINLLATCLRDRLKSSGPIVSPHGNSTQKEISVQLGWALNSFRKNLEEIAVGAFGSHAGELSGACSVRQSSPSATRVMVNRPQEVQKRTTVQKTVRDERRKVQNVKPVAKKESEEYTIVCLDDDDEEEEEKTKQQSKKDVKEEKKDSANHNGKAKNTEIKKSFVNGPVKEVKKDEEEKKASHKVKNQEIKDEAEDEDDKDVSEEKDAGNGKKKMQVNDEIEEDKKENIKSEENVKKSCPKEKVENSDPEENMDVEEGAKETESKESTPKKDSKESVQNTKSKEKARDSEKPGSDKDEPGLTSDDAADDAVDNHMDAEDVGDGEDETADGVPNLDDVNSSSVSVLDMNDTIPGDQFEKDSDTNDSTRQETKEKVPKVEEQENSKDVPSDDEVDDAALPEADRANEIDEEVDDGDSGSKKRRHSSDSEADQTRQPKRTREDIEAQRELHRELLDSDSEDENGDASEGESDDSDDDDDSDEEEENGKVSSGEEYKPESKKDRKKEDKKSKKERKKDKKKKQKELKDKGKRSKRKKKDDDDSEEESDSDDGLTDRQRRKKEIELAGKSRKPKPKSNRSDDSKKLKSSKKDDPKKSSKSDNSKTSDKSGDSKKSSKSDDSKKSDKSEDPKKLKIKKITIDLISQKSGFKISRKGEESNSDDDDDDDDFVVNVKSPRRIKTTPKSKKRNGTKPPEDDDEDDGSDDSGNIEVKRKHDSDDSHDSDLERDIKKLAQKPVIKKRKADDEDSEAEEEEEEEEEAASNKSDENDDKSQAEQKADKKKGKKKEKGSAIDDLSSDEEDAEEDEVMPMEEDQNEEDGPGLLDGLEEFADLAQPLEGMQEDQQSEDEADEDDILADSSDEDDGKSNGDEDKGKKKAKKAEKDKKSDGKDSEDSGKNEKSDEKDDNSDGSDVVSKGKKKKAKDKLLSAKLSEDSSDDFVKEKPQKNKKKTPRKKRKLMDSDEEFQEDKEEEESSSSLSSLSESSEESSEDDDEEDSSGDKKKKKKKKGKKGKGKNAKKGKGKGKGRKRIKTMDSSDENESNKDGDDDDDDDDEDDPGSAKKRKNIRKVMKNKKLTDTTKAAAKAEEDRRKRVQERQALYNEVVEEDAESPSKVPITKKLVLEKDPEIEVNTTIIRKLKPHQVEAVKFMYDCLVESLDRLKDEDGSGCILAHCMGLGKSLSLLTFVHTLLTNDEHTRLKTCLIVCPLNTCLNWQNEWSIWQEDLEDRDILEVYEMSSIKNNWSRADYLDDWAKNGGIMIMGYEMYRNLSQLKRVRNKKQKGIFTKTLIDPGPDIVVCDEGHILKNDNTGVAKALNQVRSKRRVVLTGTPLQNNLVEYHCMVNFVKPNLLGTKKEFMNRFVNPISNGQCSDSTPQDVKLMKKRAHILHESLAGCVQRKDYSALTKFLPPKREYVVLVRLSEIQITLYQKYMDTIGQAVEGGSLSRTRLFADYQALMRIWTHPWVLKLDEIRQENKKLNSYDSEDSFINDDSDDEEEDMSLSDSSSEKNVSVSDDDEPKSSGVGRRGTRRTRGNAGNSDEDEVVKDWKTRRRGGTEEEDGAVPSTSKVEEVVDEKISSEWWAEYFSEEDRFRLEMSGKLTLLAEILKMCEAIGDKLLVFSQSLLSLDLIEDFLDHWDSSKDRLETQVAGLQGWTKGADYYRMDGSTSAELRKRYSENFNDPENTRARLFLISTRAGSLGTNLVGANRVIIFDASWNPSYDTQSMFRVYRFGQIKPVYIYRFVAQGTMEEKIYERQVTKLSLSQRVVDEHQIERHFTMRDLQELYTFKPDRLDDPSNPDRPIPELPSDRLLAELLSSQKDWIVQYHQHDSLLENQLDEGLSEEDRKAAWEEYEAEKKGMFRREPRQSWEASQNYNYLTSQMSQMPPINLMELSRSIYMQNPEFTPEQVQMKMHQMIQVYRQRQEQFLLMQRERERLMELHLQRQMQQAASGAPRGVSSMLLNLMQGQGQQQQQDQQ